MKKIVCITVLAMVAGSLLFAQEAPVSPVVDETELLIQADDSAGAAVADRLGVFTAWDFIRMVLVLAAVVGAIYIIFYFLKRSGNPKIQENRLIRVLSSRLISNGKSVHLIEVGNQVFLVGAAESNVSLLSEIVDKETLDGIRLQATDNREGEKRSFTDILSQMFGKDSKTQPKSVDAIGFLRQQRQRIKQL